MIEVLDWLTEHWDEIAAGAAAVYAVITIVVGLTPSKDDDKWLRRVADRISFLPPSNARGSISLPGAKPKRDEQ